MALRKQRSYKLRQRHSKTDAHDPEALAKTSLQVFALGSGKRQAGDAIIGGRLIEGPISRYWPLPLLLASNFLPLVVPRQRQKRGKPVQPRAASPSEELGGKVFRRGSRGRNALLVLIAPPPRRLAGGVRQTGPTRARKRERERERERLPVRLANQPIR